MSFAESPFSQLSDELWHVFGGRRRFPTTRAGSNIDLGPKIIPPIASIRREQSVGLFREALRRFVWKRQGGGSHPPTPGRKTRFTGEG